MQRTSNQVAQANNTDWRRVQEKFQQYLDEEQLTNCMRCGFCLPACPTYRETGLESASPRGRIALMKGVYDGLISPDTSISNQLDLCLGCRACESACPANVQYGQLLEQARTAIADHYDYPWHVRMLRRLVFRELFPHPKRTRLLGMLIKFYQKSGLRWVAQKSKLMHLFPPHVRGMEEILPEADGRGVRHYTGEHIFPAKGPSKGRVGMFRGCIMDILFTETNRNTVKLLTAAGYDVIIPDTQTCCGALQAHSGETELSRKLARQNIQAFKEVDVDYIASNAGGCGALLFEYDHLLKDDPEWENDARWFRSRLKDVNELVEKSIESLPLKPLPVRMTFQDSCHLRNGMKVSDAPRRLLQSIPGATYVELFESDRCCGSAGIYNMMQPAMANQLLDEKMGHVAKTNADVLVTANPGCLLQMKYGIHRAGLEDNMRAVHIVDLLVESLETADHH